MCHCYPSGENKSFYLSREGNTGILLLAMNSWQRKTLFLMEFTHSMK